MHVCAPDTKEQNDHFWHNIASRWLLVPLVCVRVCMCVCVCSQVCTLDRKELGVLCTVNHDSYIRAENSEMVISGALLFVGGYSFSLWHCAGQTWQD